MNHHHAVAIWNATLILERCIHSIFGIAFPKYPRVVLLFTLREHTTQKMTLLNIYNFIYIDTILRKLI